MKDGQGAVKGWRTKQEEDWIDFYSAATEVGRHFGVNLAVAKKRLREACAAGLMHTEQANFRQEYHSGMWQEHMEPPEIWTAVSPDEWRSRAVDVDNIPDSSGYGMVAMLNKAEFRDWLAAKPAVDSPRNTAIRGLLKVGQRPPAKLSWKEFYRKVRDEADGWTSGREPAHGFSDKQIKRVIKDMMDVLTMS